MEQSSNIVSLLRV